jgi:hypothetical protein
MSTTNFAQGPSPATGARYETFLDKVVALSGTPFDPAMQSNVAPFNPNQTAAIQQMFDVGTHLGDFDPAKIREIESPYTEDVVNATQDWFNNQNKIQSNTLLSQGIRSGNAFGGDRMGVAAAEVGGQQQLAQAPVIAGLRQSGYTQALDEYNKLKSFSVQGAEEAMKAGTVQQAQSQRELDVATANAQQRGAYPFQVANWEGAALGGIGPLTGTVGQGTTSTSASSTGVSTPPTPNPLSQALGLASVAGGLFTSKDGGRVPRLASGGYLGDDSRSDNYDDDQERQQDSSSTSVKSQDDSGTKDEVLHDIEQVGKQQPTQPETPDIFGKFKIPKYKQPYIRAPQLASASGSTGMQQTASPIGTTSQDSSSSFGSSIGGALGAAGGTAIGGPIGGAIGGAAGRLIGGLFKHGGPVAPGAIQYLEDGGPDDEGDRGDTRDTGDPAVIPRTGNPEDERVFKERMAAAPSRVTLGLDKLPTRPNIPSPDPLAPYLGTEGSRRLTGPPRGSPAGNPQQADEVSPLQLTRERVQRELEDNPRLARIFDANTTAEVGRGARARQGYQAATIDRAVQQGVPLDNIVNNPNYYPFSTRVARATTGQGVDESLWGGANPVNFGTGNASRSRAGRDVGFAGGPQTASIGAERYGIEGQAGLPYARAAGYTGPSTTPIGFGPGAPVGSQGTPLEGGPPNAAGDLEVSAQKRRAPLPGDDPRAPNLGYGPVTTTPIPALQRPPRDWSQRWATNPLTQAGIAMLRSQSPYFATGLGEGLAGAAGSIEHNREDQLLDSKYQLRSEFPTYMWQRGDGTMVDSHIPNPSYDARSVPRDRLNKEIAEGKKAQWKPTGYTHPESGSDQFYDAATGRVGWSPATVPGTKPPGPLMSEVSGVKPAPTTQQPPAQQPPAQQPQPNQPQPPAAKPAAAGPVVPGPIPGRNTPTTSAVNPLQPIAEVDPEDPLNPSTEKGVIRRPNPGVLTSNRNHYNKVMTDVRTTNAAAENTLGQLSRLEGELAKLPPKGLLSQGPGAGVRNEAARLVNWTVGTLGGKPPFDPRVVGAMEAAFKDTTVGGFLQSRLTGGGQHNAQAIVQMAVKAFPGAEMTVEGARVVIAANREAAQRERDHYNWMNNPKNIAAYHSDADAMENGFFRYHPAEMYAARAAVSVISPADIDALKNGGNDPRVAAAFEKKYPGVARWIR